MLIETLFFSSLFSFFLLFFCYLQTTGVVLAGTSDPTPAAEQPVDDQTNTAGGPELEGPPPPKKTALEELLGGAFTEQSAAQPISDIDIEIENYRNGACIDLKCCPLKWWKENEKQYPLLSPVAKAFLSIPATSVPSERVFSTAGDIVSAQRSQLLPENVDVLVFLKKNM